jgi:hypothetical protein
MTKPTRKNSPPIKVYCLPEERAQLESQARASCSSLSGYLLHVGLGYRVQGMLDQERVDTLSRINGDLGRLGGLLKLWLTDDVRVEEYGEATIRSLLSKIEHTQRAMLAAIYALTLPPGDLNLLAAKE